MTIYPGFRLVEMSPLEASQLLERNTSNRPISSNRVDLLKSHIANGTFSFNGDTIKLSADGKLLDGQHRLTAIAESERSVLVAVVDGLAPEVVATIDQGKPRSVSDILKFRDVHIGNATLVSAIATGLLGSNLIGRADRQVVANYVEANVVELEDWALWAKRVAHAAPLTEIGRNRGNVRTRIFTGAPLGTLAIFMTRSGANQDAVRFFFEGIADYDLSGTERDRQTFSVLRKRMVKTAPLSGTVYSGPGGGRQILGEYAMLINHYNKWRRGDLVKGVKPTERSYSQLSDLPFVYQG